MENLTRCTIRAFFSQERMTYMTERAKVIYQSRDGKEEEVFNTFEWLDAMRSHVSNKGESRLSLTGLRYYG